MYMVYTIYIYISKNDFYDLGYQCDVWLYPPYDYIYYNV